MGHRRSQAFLPGDLVYYWRNQVPLKEKTTQHVGRFLGPARVIATETRRDDQGELRPGNVVWFHRAGRLIRASPEQLKASPFEIQLEEFKGPLEISWTITSLTTEQGKHAYIDISHEAPTDEQWEDAQQFAHQEPGGEEEIPSTQAKKTTLEKLDVKKRTVETGKGKRDITTMENTPIGTSSRSSSRARLRNTLNDPYADLHCDYSSFYAEEQHCKAVEIEWDLPTSKKGLKKFLGHPKAYVDSQIKRRQVEVRERTLSPEEAIQFTKAKHTEVRNFIAAECVEKAKGVIPD